MRIPLAAAVTLCLLTAACASDVANRYYGTQTYAARPQAEVAILRARPARGFTVIADFQSRGESAADLQAKAAKIGADAVIVSFLGGLYDRGEQWAGEDSMSNTVSHIVGTAIRYN